MKKVIIIPDSYKETMASAEICQVIEKSVGNHYPEAEIVSIPVADGGEGSVDAFLAAVGGEKISKYCIGPYEDEYVEGYYGMLPGNIAIVEMAAAASLSLAGNLRNPSQTTTLGVGELIRDALDRGAKKIILGLGGSCTNDAACGLASFLGVEFYDENGQRFLPVGGNLDKVRDVDFSKMDPRLKEVPIVCMCDIDNPFYGEDGAAYVFAPQKGADENMVERLDDNLRYFADFLKERTGIDVQKIPGSGAAGGMGGGMAAMFGSSMTLGIEAVLDIVHFDDILEGADLVITGEGKLDRQSLRGKVVMGVARRAEKQGVKTIAIVGDIGDGIEAIYDEGVSGVFSINRVAVDNAEARLRAREDMALTVDNVMRFIKSFGY